VSAEATPIRYARNGEASIAFTTRGEGPLDILFIGGFVGHLEILRELPIADAFLSRLESFARVIYFDKRGMGLSDRGGAYTLEDITADAIAVLDAAGSERAAILGISEGGPAAILLAASHPDRVSSLILYGTYARLPRAPDYPAGLDSGAVRRFWRWMRDHWGEPATARMWAPSMARDPELLEWWGRLLRSSASPGVVETLGEMYEQLDVRAVLPSIRVPTLVLLRDADLIIPAELVRGLAEEIPEARLVELPGADHLLFVGETEPVLAAIEEFLTGRAPAEPDRRMLATVLFTDLVDSTGRAAELGDRRWRELLGRYTRSGEREVGRRRGRVIKSTGDGLLASFDGPARAARAALALREATGALGLEDRAGIHTGEVELIGEDIGGLAVHIASRVQAEAEPGQVLATSTVRDLVIGSGLEFRELGPRALKGVPGKIGVVEVSGDREAGPVR
jgi:pimeloyl-ACP methyl ester carboxylesterase